MPYLKKIKLVFFNVLFFLVASSLCGQTKNTFDSLVLITHQSVHDSIKSNIFNKLAWLSTKKIDYKKTVKYADSALIFAERTNNKRKIADAYLNLGEGYYNLGSYELSVTNSLKALKIYEELKLPARQAIALTLSGNVFYEQNKLDASLTYFLKALELYKNLNDLKGISYCYNNMSLVYYFQSNYPLAIKSLEESVRLKKVNGEENMLGSTYTNLGMIYIESGKESEGLDLYKKAMAIYKKNKDDSGRALVYINTGDYYLAKKNFKVARQYYDSTLTLAIRTNYIDYQKSAYGGLAKVYQKEGNHKEALNYYIRYSDLKDSLVNEANTKNVSELQTQYETDKKEKENKLLQTQNQLSKETIKQQQTTTYFIVTGLILSLLLAIFIFRGLRQQRKANQIISQQKLEVELQKHIVDEKQKEIIDSINYAKRIQQSLLPTHKYIERILKKK